MAAKKTTKTASKTSAKKVATNKAAPSKKAPAKKTKKAPVKPVAAGTYAEMAAASTGPSKVENPVAAMWNLCDQMVDSKRKDVIARAVAEGISYYTARTQYQLWRTAYLNSNGFIPAVEHTNRGK